MKRSCFWRCDQPGSVAVIFAVALMMLMGVAAEVRALALPDCTSFPNWNSALAAAKATVQGNIAAGALLHDFNADNSLQKIQTGFRDLSWTSDTVGRIFQSRITLPKDGRIRQ